MYIVYSSGERVEQIQTKVRFARTRTQCSHLYGNRFLIVISVRGCFSESELVNDSDDDVGISSRGGGGAGGQSQCTRGGILRSTSTCFTILPFRIINIHSICEYYIIQRDR